MEISFLGAARTVTGSSFLISHDGFSVIVDLGLAQGGDEDTVGRELPVSPYQVDAVVLTHAHIDHSGRLPLLAKEGYAGPIYATGATRLLCSIMLADSAHIQESDAEWEETLATCKKARFAEIHVFPFSARPGTPAAAMPNQVDSATKSKRVHAMLSLSKAMRAEYEKAFYGRKLPVLIEEKEGGYCLGHSENYLLCRFRSIASVGEIVEVVFGPDVAAD